MSEKEPQVEDPASKQSSFMSSTDPTEEGLSKDVVQETFKEPEVAVETVNHHQHQAAASVNDEDAEAQESPSKRLKTDDEDIDEEYEADIKEKLMDAWKQAKLDGNMDKAFETTVAIISNEIESMTNAGIEAFQQWEKCSRELKVLKEDMKYKDEEIERLHLADEKNRATISNLMEISETAAVDARNASQAAIKEASLRAEVSMATALRDEALGEAEEYKRKTVLLEEQLHNTKTKLAHATQAKLKMERDQRANASLLKSLDSHSSNADTEYYKRKVNELTGHIQGLQATIAEKNRQMEEMRRQLERNVSQNRMEGLRAGCLKTKGAF